MLWIEGLEIVFALAEADEAKAEGAADQATPRSDASSLAHYVSDGDADADRRRDEEGAPPELSDAEGEVASG